MRENYSGLGAWLRSGLMVVGLSVSAAAAASDDLDVTMRMVVDDSDITDSVVREIQLPEVPEIEASAAQGDPGVPGLGRAGEARDSGRDFGRSVAEEVRQSGGAADSIREKPERPERPSELPDQIQDLRKDGPPGLNR